MTIVTKFKAGDEVWYIEHNKAQSGTINYIQIMLYRDKATVDCDLLNVMHRKFKEHELHKSREELLQSL